tara:strand:- start:531 stop:827 length:297 start_codon:yes stop_codon:yes gene_type:complete
MTILEGAFLALLLLNVYVTIKTAQALGNALQKLSQDLAELVVNQLPEVLKDQVQDFQIAEVNPLQQILLEYFRGMMNKQPISAQVIDRTPDGKFAKSE